jgi:hypothetical protein
VQIIFAGQLADDTVRTQIEVVGPAKARAHVGDAEVVASGAQSDVREKAWH